MSAPFDIPEAAEAQAIHMRRQLEQAAALGAALLEALDLSPLALDALDAAIATLDALDAPTEDMEPHDVEDCCSLDIYGEGDMHEDDEDGGDDEPTLGAPERSPYVASMTSTYYEPPLGRGGWRGFKTCAWNQVRWAQGSRQEGEGEPDVGYDLPEDTTPDEDGLSRPWLKADRVFGLRVNGDCCAPAILDGGAVHVDKEARPVAGDFVAIFFEGWRDGRYGMQGWVKRLAMNLPPNLRWPFYSAPGNELSPVLFVESLNPPQGYMLDVTKVHAVFKVVDILPPAYAIHGETARHRASQF